MAARTLELTQSREHLRALATEVNLAGQRSGNMSPPRLHDYLAQLLAQAEFAWRKLCGTR